jgi:two-component system chemotaxis response regulator CheB
MVLGAFVPRSSNIKGSKKKVRVAIVDDSLTIRTWLRILLEADPRFEIVGEAKNSTEARDLLKTQEVDVLTLDVEMPGMSGLEFLDRVMRSRPMPVVMISALTDYGSDAAIEAFALGAVDCIAKPRTGLDEKTCQNIRSRIWDAAQARVTSYNSAGKVRGGVMHRFVSGAAWHGDMILLGSSTGGIGALETILEHVDQIPVPIVIAQHMPDMFLKGFVQRLNQVFSRNFILASSGHILRANECVICLGKDVSTYISKSNTGEVIFSLAPPSKEARYRPSVDDLFLSAAQTGITGSAAVLTGMGNDGARGLLALRNNGVDCVVQDEASCVVYGMPKAARAIGAARAELSPDEIGRIFYKGHQGKSNIQESVL